MSISNNNTTIVFSVDASGVESGVNKLKASASQATASMDAMAKKAAQVDAVMKESANNGYSLNARAAAKLVDQYDRLAASAGKTAQQQLAAKAATMGITDSFAAQNAAIIEATKHTHEFGFATAASKRELLVLAHELSQGNYKKFGGSLMVLGEQTGAAGLLFSAAGLGALAMGGAIAGAAFKIVQGSLAFDELNKSAIVTNGYLGLTTGQLKTMAESTAGTAYSLTTVQAAMTALITSGQMTGDTLGLATRVTVQFAQDTGQAVDDVAKSLVKFAEDPQKALEDLQGQYHIFNQAQAEVIEGYINTGDKAAAYKAILEGMDEAHDRFKNTAESDIGYIGKLWEGLKRTAEAYGNSIAHIGVKTTDQEKLTDALKRQAMAQAAVNQLDETGRPDRYGYRNNLASANAEVASLQKVTDAQKAAAAAQAKITAGGDAVVHANAYLNSSTNANPARQRELAIQKENAAYKLATTNLNTSATEYEKVVKVHQENLAKIDSDYAKRTKPKSVGDGAQNAELARLRGANQLIEAEERRSETVLKGQKDAGLIDTETYFNQLHDIQAKALKDQIANAELAVETARGKKEQSAYETATATYQKLIEARNKVDADRDAALEKYRAKRTGDIAKYGDQQNGRVAKQASGFKAEDDTRDMSPEQASAYKSRLDLYQQFLSDQQALKEKFDTHSIDATEYAADLGAAGNAYSAQLSALDAHLAQEKELRDSYGEQFKQANLKLMQGGITPAEGFAAAYTTAFDDTTKALDDFVTKGQFSFASFTSGVLADMAKIALKVAETSALQAMFGGSGSGLLSTAIGALSGGLSTATAAPVANAIGGDDVLGSFLSLTGYAHANGGHITGPGTGTSDSIPAMLSNGEYVINAKAAAQHKGLLDSINYNIPARFATGGAVGTVAPSSASSGDSSSTSAVGITIHNNSGTSLDQNDAVAMQQQIQSIVDARMRQKMSSQGGYAYQIRHGMICAYSGERDR